MARDPRDVAAFEVLERRRLVLVPTPAGWQCQTRDGKVIGASAGAQDPASSAEAAEAAIVAGEQQRSERMADLALKALATGRFYPRPRREPDGEGGQRVVWDVVAANGTTTEWVGLELRPALGKLVELVSALRRTDA